MNNFFRWINDQLHGNGSKVFKLDYVQLYINGILYLQNQQRHVQFAVCDAHFWKF